MCIGTRDVLKVFIAGGCILWTQYIIRIDGIRCVHRGVSELDDIHRHHRSRYQFAISSFDQTTEN